MIEPSRFGRNERLHYLRDLIERESIGSQSEIAERLVERGVEATQSSVSRDLKELGAVKVAGVYTIPTPRDAVANVLDRILARTRARAVGAGPHQLVVHTIDGEAGRVARAIDEAQLPGVHGTIAGRNTVFIATATMRDRLRVEARIASARR